MNIRIDLAIAVYEIAGRVTSEQAARRIALWQAHTAPAQVMGTSKNWSAL